MKKSLNLIIALIFIIAIAVVIGIVLLNNNSNNDSTLKFETAKDMKAIINSIYKNSELEAPDTVIEEVSLENDYLVTSLTGLQSTTNIKTIVSSEPLISPMAYSLVLIKTTDNADVEAIKSEIYNNIDMRKWICVSAEKLYITNSENLIFVIMSSEENAKPAYEEFKKLANGKIGKELEKSFEEDDFELPPEMF